MSMGYLGPSKGERCPRSVTNRRGEAGIDGAIIVVVLASVLFFSGISQQFRLVTLRAILLSMAVVLCVIGLYHIAVYPVQ
jgi:hypothetical protein